MIIQPALTVDKILSWTPGTSYNVICMVAEDTSNQARVDYRQRFSACHDAPEKYVSRAVETLGVFVKSLANSLKNMQDFEELVRLARKQHNLEDGELLPLRANRNRLLTEKTIICPVFSEAKLVNSKVAIITLTHSIPDPYLLCVKAAVNWSNANDQKILPGCVYEYEDEESVDSSIQLLDEVFGLRSDDEEISDLDEEG